MDQRTLNPLPAEPLVSVVMPAHNAAPWIGEAINSLLAQTWTRWELIVVNDGSTDGIVDVLATFTDPRITVSHQPKRGVSAARNSGLDRCTGDLICFLDADDRMPPAAIASRIAVFREHPGLSFVDGVVEYRDAELRQVLRTHRPAFSGEPFARLIRFDPACFFGNTWMIRRDVLGTARFDTSLSHAEDLLLYMTIAPGRQLGFTTGTVLHYRRSASTSMSRLDALERSYWRLLAWMRGHPELVSNADLRRAGFRIRRMMSGAYWHAGRLSDAIMVWLPGRSPSRLR